MPNQSRNILHRVRKNIPDIFDCNLKKDYWILIIYDTDISNTTGDQMTVQFSTARPLSASALPGKTKPVKYCIFVLFHLFGFYQVVQKQAFGEVGTRTVI